MFDWIDEKISDEGEIIKRFKDDLRVCVSADYKDDAEKEAVIDAAARALTTMLSGEGLISLDAVDM